MDDALARAGDEPAQAAGEIAETVGEGIDAAREAGGERVKIAYDPQICFSGRCGRSYCDLYVIRDDDVNVSERLRSDEVSFFSSVRRCGYP